ncbi:MAG: phosphodiester glycosidase family protein, partial [Ktedonobacteraceae bacterium]
TYSILCISLLSAREGVSLKKLHYENAVTKLKEGQMDKSHMPVAPSDSLNIAPPQKTRKTRGQRLRRAFVVCSMLLLISAILLSQGNGEVGAWFADTSRAILGPTITAQIEAWYLGGNDLVHQMEYHLSGQSVAAPWTIGPTPTIGIPPTTSPNLPTPMALPNIAPIVTSAIAGEGTWITQEMAPAPYNALPLVAKTFFQPDPSHPYAVVTLLQFDSRFVMLHMVAGSREPGGPRGNFGPGRIPATDQSGNALLAAFNGGFKYSDGQYGMKVNGVVYVPPQSGAATLAVTREGQIILGAWGVDPRLNNSDADLVAWRQNASLLIDQGTINPLTHDGAAWGGTILNRAYTWRSGIGITAQGTLVYAAGNSLTALTLATALKAAGAVTAMQTDINPLWVRAFLYARNSQGKLTIAKLNPSMQGNGTEYLNSTERDFFYLTRIMPSSLPPSQTHSQ